MVSIGYNTIISLQDKVINHHLYLTQLYTAFQGVLTCSLKFYRTLKSSEPSHPFYGLYTLQNRLKSVLLGRVQFNVNAHVWMNFIFDLVIYHYVAKG